ncbi:HPP family protein [Methyloglobulus sp.]|uniref:HPP family protein n=1 Tax=Methyloglobulus sp. TaxID=2518622 RepID=UPI0032B7F4E7
MNINRLFRAIPVDPVNLSFKGKLLSVASCFTVILAMAWVSQQFTLPTAYPMLIASMGASAVIVFIIPNSPLAQPWPLVGGQLVSTVIGIVCAQIVSDTAFASAFAVGGSVLAMLLLRCLHPPGAASALTPVISGDSIVSLGYGFVLLPVSLNIAVMLVLAIVVNRWLLRHEYPTRPRKSYKNSTHDPIVELTQQPGISEQDVEQVLQKMDTFMDVSTGDLSRLLADVQMQSVKRHSTEISCADIMVGNVLTVEYGTDVEEAWKLMQRENLKALPVIDKSRRVIGIITWHDFFKFINMNTRETFQERFQAFIRRTPDISTDKPESVGHIMSSPVIVRAESTHIIDLIPLLSNEGFRQIPIVNNEKRLVGMVYQANLIAALHLLSWH